MLKAVYVIRCCVEVSCIISNGAGEGTQPHVKGAGGQNLTSYQINLASV